MKKGLIFFLICIFLINVTFVSVNAQQVVNIYVDSNATAEGNGEINSPFRTLEGAREYIRELKRTGAYPQGGVIVNLRGGVYSRNNVFLLEADDGGMENAPVVYKAYANEEVKIVGGTELRLNAFKISENSAIDSSAKGKIYSYNLKQNGISAYTELTVTGHSAYYLQEMGFSKPGPNLPIPLYNEEPCTVARYPNEGYMTVDTVIEPGDAVRHWYEKEKSTSYVPESQRTYPPKNMTFTVNDARISKWVNAKHLWAHGYWYHDWSDQTTSITKVDPDNGSLQTGYPSAYSVRTGQRFYVYNLLEELDVPGEWYYDIDSGEFYIYPRDNNPESTILLPFMNESLIRISGAKNLEIRGITFSGARKAGIEIVNSENVEVAYCTMSHTASNGINITGGKNCTVKGCHLYDVGDTGIAVSAGNKETLEPACHLVTNNWIHDFANVTKTYMPAIRLDGVGNIASYNLIYDAPHAAITFDGCDHIIEYNDISDVLKEANDMAAIYSGRNFTHRGTVIRGNIIHDIASNSETTDTPEVYAVYFDDLLSGVTVTENIFYNLPYEAVFINGGRANEITNNIFVNMDSGIRMNCAGRAVRWNLETGFIERLGLDTGIHLTEPYAKYPHLQDILEDSPMDAKYNVFKNNVSCNVKEPYLIQPLNEYGSPVTYDELKGMNEFEEGYVAENEEAVGFVSAEKGDYSLKSDSDVFNELSEFKNIDAKKAGLITSRLANELSDAVALVIGNPNTYVNWERKLIDEENTAVTAFIENDYTYVPVRYLAEMLGGSVTWDNGMITIDYNGTILKLNVNSNVAQIDGAEIELNTPVIIREGRTFVPLRDCSQLFNKKVFWDDRGLIIVSDTEMDGKFDNEMIEDLINRL